MKKITLLTIALLSSGILLSCDCTPPSLKTEIKEAELIFSGLLIEKIQNDSTHLCYFKTYDVWKGYPKDTLIISLPLTSDTCYTDYDTGKEYLIFADKTGFTNLCHRNSLLTETADPIYLELTFNETLNQAVAIDNDTKINEQEAYFLNELFQTDEIDFINQRVIFFNGKMPIGKKKYFDTIKKDFYSKDKYLILNKEERKQAKADVFVFINNPIDVVKTRETYLTILKMR